MPSHFFRVVIASYVAVVGILSAASAFGAEVRQPETIRNWSAPAYWSPPAANGNRSSARSLAQQSDLTGALPFVPVTPCRIVDTRGPAGTFGGPSLPASAPRNFPLPTGPCAGIPASVSAYSLNITVTNTLGPGFLSIYPQGGAAPLISTLNYLAGETVANAAIVPAGTSGGITVVAGVSGTDLIIDINGYYSTGLNNGESFRLAANVSGTGAIYGLNLSGSGVFGQSIANDGVHGVSSTGSGVYGVSGGTGVYGDSFNADGVHGHTLASGFSGVAGLNEGNGFGVYGSSTLNDGVHGVASGPSVSGVAGLNSGAGNGVYGASNQGTGVFGGSTAGEGVHGFSSSTSGGSGVHAQGTLRCNLVDGTIEGCTFPGSDALYVEGVGSFSNFVHISGDLHVIGIKNFIAPHPTDPSKQVAFVSLEGPEAGTYFRGTGRIVGGRAEIEVPESFRAVTSASGLSVVVSPAGELATLAVVSKSLDQIVVAGSQDVEFDYVVNGVRAGYDKYQAIQNNLSFVPRNASDASLAQMPTEAVRRLKANGILNEDGSINEETARRLGWDQKPGWNAAVTTRSH
jgi:hypothetical protein